jgi:hypothetical protein
MSAINDDRCSFLSNAATTTAAGELGMIRSANGQPWKIHLPDTTTIKAGTNTLF